MIKLDQLIGNEGLTVQDLILTLLKELAKHKMMCAGVIMDLEQAGELRLFGHGTEKAMGLMLELGVKGLGKGKVKDMQRFEGEGN